MKITSQAQAAFLGAAAAGKAMGDGPKPEKARKMLRENAPFKMRDLPMRAPTPRIRRVSTRGGR